MTNTDKIEISNLLNGLKEMNDYATKTNEKYVDNKVVDFATKAKEDYLANKKYLIDIIQNNLGLFFNLDNLCLGYCAGCLDGLYASRGEKFSCSIGSDVNVVCSLTDFTVLKNNGYHIYFRVKGMKIHDIRFYTSDCRNRENDYSVCSAWDLVDQGSDIEAKTPYETPKNVSGWQKLYGLATWTRAKNSILVKYFKIAMNERISLLREKANANEKRFNNIKNIGVYTKVDL